MRGEAMAFPLWYHPLYTDGIHPEARFPRDRYVRLLNRLTTNAPHGAFNVRTPNAIQREVLHLAHDATYVERFLNGELDASEERRIGLRPWTPDMIERTMRLMGGAVEATEHVVRHGGFAGNMAGGTHHAHREFGSGYCVFNDLAVCALHAITSLGLERVAVLDLDVHQGDGTASILADEPRVLTVSVHCATNFPFRKAVSDHDLVLEPGSGDDAYLEAAQQALDLCLGFEPDLLLFQAGVDGLEADALGKLSVSREGMQQRNASVFDAAAARTMPTVVFMGGGYANPIDATLDAFEDLFLAAADAHQRCTTTA
ncbi:MAG: histone deacetylase [Candidatus Thermoplasmatota archaeon]|nr:histone deacetylase [Candidatus Thermoplasmatota archaeon]